MTRAAARGGPDSTASDRGIAYDRYRAALNREEQAAHGYKHALERAQAT